MKHLLKQIAVTSTLLVAAGQASAHDIINSLGTAASATDWFTVNCPATAAEMYADVVDTSAADGVVPSIMISKTGALNSTDSPEGGANSPGVTLANGSGVYNIYITHSGASAAVNNYTAHVHCQTAAHAHTATQPNPITKQDQ